ncbi:MAG: vanadium-dependent haloperoxidase, partial [Bacteroidota bacterium]
YFNLAAYEATMQGMPDYKSVAGLYPGLSMPHSSSKDEYHWPTVVNAVYATMIKNFVPGNIIMPAQQTNIQFKILAQEQKFYDDFQSKVPADIFNRSKEHGIAVANAMWEWSKTDPYGHEAYLNPRPDSYTPPSGPGLWQPTAPDYGKAMYPYWGSARTFAISEEDKLARPPVSFSENPESPFYGQAYEVRNIVKNIDFTNKWIAEFWSDDQVGVALSPPSRWIAIANQILQDEADKGNADMELALYAYAKVSVALNDAGVACWYSKYTYNVERPVSFINRVIDPNWQVHYLGFTPSFPAYPSGHSTFGAAAAEVLSHIFGYDYAFTDFTHENRTDFYGMPRKFASFREAAEENAYSRVPLGVHYRMDAEEGVRHGYQIGSRVNGMPFKK